MAHKADDEEVCFQLFDQPDDAVDDVAGDKMDLDRRPGPFRLCLCRIDDRGEAVVRFDRFFRYLIDASGKSAAVPRLSPCDAQRRVSSPTQSPL
jgi:hypothetical protein